MPFVIDALWADKHLRIQIADHYGPSESKTVGGWAVRTLDKFLRIPLRSESKKRMS